MTYSSLAIATAPLWRTIEQPPALKLLVAALGLALIVASFGGSLAPMAPGWRPAKERVVGNK